MEKYFGVISENPLFSGLDNSSVKDVLLLLKAKKISYKKGDIVHSSNEKLSRFGLVLEGSVNVCIDDINGDKMIMADVQKGETFGESICILEIENSYIYAYATEKTVVLWLDINSVYEQKDELSYNIQKRFTKMLALRTLSMNKRIQVLSKLKLRDRIITYLTEFPQKNNNKIFNVSLNREDMATFIGSNRSALSRELSKMKKEGIIDYYRDTFKIL